MPIHGRVHVVRSVLIVLANMAPGPPTHWIIFVAVDVISLGPLINLLDGLKLKLGGFIPCSFESFIPWQRLLGDSVSWLKVLFFRVFPFSFVCFCYIYLIVALVPFVFGFSVHLLGCHCPLSFGYTTFECGGVLVSTISILPTLVTFLPPLVSSTS